MDIMAMKLSFMALDNILTASFAVRLLQVDQ